MHGRREAGMCSCLACRRHASALSLPYAVPLQVGPHARIEVSKQAHSQQAQVRSAAMDMPFLFTHAPRCRTLCLGCLECKNLVLRRSTPIAFQRAHSGTVAYGEHATSLLVLRPYLIQPCHAQPHCLPRSLSPSYCTSQWAGSAARQRVGTRLPWTSCLRAPTGAGTPHACALPPPSCVAWRQLAGWIWIPRACWFSPRMDGWHGSWLALTAA